MPRPSKRYSETVCCAGITAYGEFRRLYPVRFRHLSGHASFKRWDWVSFKYREPTSDSRHESCHVAEESISIDGKLKQGDRASFLEQHLSGSGEELTNLGRSLGLVRPRNTRFFYQRKSEDQLEKERQAFSQAARQGSLLESELAEFEPTPYKFNFTFTDDAGLHTYTNADWEAHAMFFKERHRSSETEALRWMSERFNEEYPAKGMLFALGNVARRPQTWQLLGVLRVDQPVQRSLL